MIAVSPRLKKALHKYFAAADDVVVAGEKLRKARFELDRILALEAAKDIAGRKPKREGR